MFTSNGYLDEYHFSAWHYYHVLAEGPPESFFGKAFEAGTEAGTSVENVELEST